MHGEAQPYRMPIRPCFGWGLPSHAVTNMLVRSYRTFSAFLLTRMRQWEFKFLQHFPSGFPARPLAGILPQEARTFLMRPEGLPRPSGPHSVGYCIIGAQDAGEELRTHRLLLISRVVGRAFP